MPSFLPVQVGLSYPKARTVLTKVINIARTDSSTVKCVLPKDAVVIGVDVLQEAAAVTGAATFNLGWAGATTALLNAFSMATSSVGLARAGSAAGSALAVKQGQDRAVISTYSVGTSTAGGTGKVFITYFVPAAGEQADD
jgi:hypothetical protein